MPSSHSFRSPTSAARHYILYCLSDGAAHSAADLKTYAISHIPDDMRSLCTRGVFSGIFTRLLTDGHIVSPRRGIYQITSSGLTYAQSLMQDDPSAPEDAAASPDQLVPLMDSAPLAAAITIPQPNDFTVQLHTALEAAHRTLEAACTFNVLHLSEQDFQLIREVEELLSRISDLEQKTV